MRVLHLDTEMGWRGGENQLRLLLQGLKDYPITSHLAARPGSAAALRLGDLATVITYPMRGGFDPVAAYRIASYCRTHQIDLIDAHTGNGHSLGLMVKMLLPQVKLVVHRRVDNVPKQNYVNRKKYLSRHVDRYVAISQAIGRILENLGVPSDRITVVRSAVPGDVYRDLSRTQEKHELAKAFGISPELMFIGNASALSPQKGYPTLLRAAKVLKDKKMPFHVFIAGDGELRPSLESMRIALGLEHDVTFLGFINEVPRFLSALDILAMPSVNEGLGTLLLDASLAGCAIAATNVGGIPEVISDGKTGLLSTIDDVEQLAANLIRLIQDEALRHDLSANARNQAAREFSWEAMVRGNAAVYSALVKP